MADDRPPGDAAAVAGAGAEPSTEGRRTDQYAPVVDKVAGVRRMLSLGYSIDDVVAWATNRTPDKGWVASKVTARRYVDKALETIDGEVVQPKNRKQARTRAMLTLFARRAYELATDDSQKHKAAGLITAGVGALDKVAKIDGSYAYDPISFLPPSVNPASPEEAARIVAHAQAMLDLARRRGALVVAQPDAPAVIDVAVADEEDEGADIDAEAESDGSN